MPLLDFLNGSANGDANGNLWTRLKSLAGTGIGKLHRSSFNRSSDEALPMGVKNDDTMLFSRGDRKGNLMIGNYIPELIDTFEGATMNIQKWIATNTTFAPAQSTVGGYNFNNGNSIAANAVSILQSQRLFYKYPRVPLQVKLRVRANISTNSRADYGWGFPTTTTLAVPNGLALRIVDGLWYMVNTFNGAEVGNPSVVLKPDNTQFSTANTNSEYYVVDIIVDDDNAIVTVQNTSTGELVAQCDIAVPLSSLAMWGATALPFYARVWNSATPPAIAPIFTLGYVQVLSTDWKLNPDMSQVASNLGLTIGRNPFTGAALSQRANSTVPATATLSNTTAAYTNPDGGFVFAAVAGAETDYLLVAFQVPAGSKFIFSGVLIELHNQVVAVATTPTIFEWQVGHNQSAASLATANILRNLVGTQTLTVGALPGQKADKINIDVDDGEITESGRFVTLSVRIPTGTATATETFRGIYHIKGRFI